MINSTGILRYRPSWWIWLEVDYELGRYLRHLFHLATYRCIKLGKPSWGEHITVVISREYNERFLQFWEKYDGETIHFSCLMDLDTNGNAFWTTIVSPRLDEIRAELGLGEPFIPLHFGFGYLEMGKSGLTFIDEVGILEQTNLTKE